MGFLDERVKQSVRSELAINEQKAQDDNQRLIDAFCSGDNLDILVRQAGTLVRQAYVRGNIPISQVRLDMSIKHDTYSQPVADSTLCKDALLAALRRAEPSTADAELVWNTREIDYSSYVTDKWIEVSFEPPLE